MSPKKLSPVWTWIILLMPVPLACWSGYLILSVAQLQAELRDRVIRIRLIELTQRAFHPLEDRLIDVLQHGPREELLRRWQDDAEACRNRIERLAAQLPEDSTHGLTHALHDAVLASGELLHEDRPPDGADGQLLALQRFRRIIDAALVVTDELLADTRRQSSDLAIELDARWRALNTVVFVSWLLAVLVVALVHGYRVSTLKLKGAELERDRLFQTSRDLHCVASFDGRFQQLNPRWTEVFGYPIEALRKEPCAAFIHPDDRELTAAEEQKLIAGASSVNFTNRYRTVAGEYRLLSWTATADVVRKRIYGTARDITEQRRSEERLRLTQFTIDQAADAVYWTNRDGRLLYVNDAACRALGYSRGQLEQMSVTDIADGLTPDLWRSRWQDIKRRGSFTFESAQRRRDGSLLPVEVTVNYLQFGDQEFNCAFARDITGRKRAEEQLRESEQRLKSVLAACTQVAIVATDPDGLITVFNSGAERMLGYPAAELVGRRTPLCFHDAEEVAGRGAELSRQFGTPIRGFEVFAAPARHGDFEPREWTFVRKGGQRLTASLVITTMRDSRGQLTGFLGVAMDVTERRRIELAIRDREARLRAIVDTAPDGILTFNARGVIESCNAACGRMFGFPPEELVGRQVTALLPGQPSAPGAGDGDGGDLAVDAAVAPAASREVLARRSNGSSFPALLAVSAFDVGRERLFTAIARDITTLKAAQHELRDFAHRLARSNRELQDFASIASHDLQEPLRKVQTFGERLQEDYADVLGDTGRDYLSRMRSAADRMRTLIRDLLAYSRVTTRGSPFESVDLERALQNVLADLEVRIMQTGAQVQVGDLAPVRGDPTQIRQLLQNLIGNALKFARPGTAPQIHVWTDRGGTAGGVAWNAADAAAVRLHVEDNGIGFDSRHAERIFKMFERLHGRDEYEGTGMGLAICRKIAERHGGSISAIGRPGEGTRFTVTIPLDPGECANCEDAAAAI